MNKRTLRLKSEIGAFMRQYQRTAKRQGCDPNDRQYDRKLEATIKQMQPEELDALINDTHDELLPPKPHKRKA